ncbi:polysaccharide biosynthesis/export family protein [Deferrisoma palaeochoriense]
MRGLAAVALVLGGCALAPPPVVELPAAPPAEVAATPRTPEPPPSPPLPPDPAENRVFACREGRCEYRLGPGDRVEAVFLGEPDLPVRQFPVEADGYLALPHVGRLKAGGRTLTEVRAEVEARLSRLLRDPTVSLRLAEPRAHRVTLRLPDGAQVVALDGLTRLGPFLAGRYAGPERGLVTVRRGDVTWRIPLAEALDPTGAGRLVLDAGDQIAVAPEGPARFYVIGEVERQGTYPLERPTDVLQAVAQAGGFSPRARRDLVAVLRPGPEGARAIPVRLGSPGPLLEPGDVVYVGRSRAGDWNAFLEQIRPTLEVLNLTSGTGLNTRNLTE